MRSRRRPVIHDLAEGSVVGLAMLAAPIGSEDVGPSAAITPRCSRKRSG
jgi:hypothetical protein